MASVDVLDLRTGNPVGTWTCDPRSAVIAAHAQDRKDYSTWDYEARYGASVIASERGYACGDFYAFRPEVAERLNAAKQRRHHP